MSVFQIDRNYKVIVNPEAAKLVPELQSLDHDQLLYTILVVDYVDGPYRKKPLDERKLMAARRVYSKDSIKETEKLINAMVAYKGLVFDIRRETSDALKKKIRQLHKQLMDPNVSDRQIVSIDKSISFLEKRVESIERDLDIEEKESIEIKGGRKLSMIEKWQRNQKQFNEYQAES